MKQPDGDICLHYIREGGFTIILDEIGKRLYDRFSWSIHVDQRGRASLVRRTKGEGQVFSRVLTVAPDDRQVDHRNGNTLDNRLRNLRLTTNSQNKMNQTSKQRYHSSQYKGVCWSKVQNQWHAQISKDGKRQHLGYFDVEEDAARTYDEAAVKLFGEFAALNKDHFGLK